jgi:hypothetical protein
MGNAVDEKKGANATMPLTRTRVSVIALRNPLHSCIGIILIQAFLAQIAVKI